MRAPTEQPRQAVERPTSGTLYVRCAMQGLYPIIDLDALSRTPFEPLAFAERVLKARPRLLQLRAKHASARRTLELLTALRPLCDETHTALYANDRPDLALLAGASGVHLGQDDLPVGAVRKLSRTLKIGVSTHDLAELERALELEPDYVAFGPVFATQSKINPDPVVGLERLELARDAARRAGIPLVAIGGIERTRAALLAALGVSGAVISALIAESLAGVEANALALHAALGG